MTVAKAATKTAPRRDEWTWMQSTNDKDRWSTTQIPGEDIHAPYIKRMSKNSDNSWTFYVYRNQRCLGATRHMDTAKGLKLAQDMARVGKPDPKVAADYKLLMAYVEAKEFTAEKFKALSEVNQKTVANVYPWAMPSNRKLDLAGVKKPASVRTDLMSGREKTAIKSGKYNLDATIKRIKDGNPKKEGSGQHARWVTVFAFDGKTVREFLNGGGDKYGIDQTLHFEYIKLVEPK